MSGQYTLTAFLFLSLISNLVYSQQWIDEKYEYDSLLNINYGSAINFNGTETDLYLDLYLPKCDEPQLSSEWPLLIFIHGGAFIEGSKDDQSIQQYCKSFAKRGYVTATVSYRLGFISDDVAWNCNYPNYECIFATDTSEWIRAYYRGVQDIKGAIRYIVNRQNEYSVDPNNVFLAGESAGAFIAMGAGLMQEEERPLATFALPDAPPPHNNALNCSYNSSEVFSGSISRPDLGSVEGTIETSTTDYTIKGVGNFFGAMFNNLLLTSNPAKPKPSIYSFHQPCDLIVPIDSRQALWGLDWCMTNGYNCYAIANTPTAHGSQTISNWNSDNNLEYQIENHFTATSFPYSFLLGTASCIDQANNPCHAYDNKSLREEELATFFSGLVTSGAICTATGYQTHNQFLEVYPNPASSILTINTSNLSIESVKVYNLFGQRQNIQWNSNEHTIDISHLTNGCYWATIQSNSNEHLFFRFVKR